MTTTPKDKILVVGSNAGSLSALIAKITSINSKHGPFDAVIALGDLFTGDDDEDEDTRNVVAGTLTLPVPTYFMQGQRELPGIVREKVDRDAGQVSENLSFLGKQGILTLSSGLKIGTFGGSFNLEAFTSTEVLPAASSHFTSAALSAFAASPAVANLDILLTHTWPSQLARFSDKSLSETVSRAEMASWGIPALQALYARAKPKYAFSGERNLFWEREPFVYPVANRMSREAQQQQAAATRFLSLGHFGNATKQRWFYAFSVAPSSPSPAKASLNQSASAAAPDIPPNVTPCPFDLASNGAQQTQIPYGTGQHGPRGTKRAHPNTDDGGDDGGGSYIFAAGPGGRGNGAQEKRSRHGEPPQGYTCKICNVPGHWVQECPEKVDAPPAGKKAPGPPPDTYTCRLCNVPGHWIQDCPMSVSQGAPSERRAPAGPKDIAPEDCWFCLSNPQVTKHLIASIGSETYLTLPKGQLLDTSDSENSRVPGGGHCLIIPIAHYPTLASVPDELSAPIIAEIDSYKRALSSLYATHGCSALSFEVSRAGLGGKGGHAHIQILPVPDSVPHAQVEHLFASEARAAGYSLTDDAAECQAALREGNYFRVDLPSGKRLVHRIDLRKRFSLQFGRATAALVLGKAERADWKTCAKSDEEEGADAKLFKEAFAKWDPSG